jgi:hypothetical protein
LGYSLQWDACFPIRMMFPVHQWLR